MERATGGRADRFRRKQEISLESSDDGAGSRQTGNNPFVKRIRGTIAAVPVNGDGAAGAGDLRHDLLRRAAAQNEGLSAGPQTRCEAFQRLVQPPARRTAELTDLRALFIVHVEQDNRRTAPTGGGQWGIVGQPQIVAKPDERRALVSGADHSASVLSE